MHSWEAAAARAQTPDATEHKGHLWAIYGLRDSRPFIPTPFGL